MYNPKDVLTEDGYSEYLAHLHNIEAGLFFIQNHADDLHIGALSSDQEKTFWQLIKSFDNLKSVLKTGDGEKD